MRVMYAVPQQTRPLRATATQTTRQEVSRPPRPSWVSRQLGIGRPGDSYEKEADRVAGLITGVGSPWRREHHSQVPTVTSTAASQIASLPGGGEPLPAAERGFFEARFGHDFSKVRVHSDSRAAQIASAFHARAFTLGTHVVFNRGQSSAGTPNGRHLLAHELAHVLQQSPGRPTLPGAKVFQLSQSPAGTVQRQGDDKEKSGLEQLDELLDQMWASRPEVLAALGQLSESEKQTVLTGTTYRDKLVYQLRDDDMIQALRTLDAPCETRRDWLKAEGVSLSYLGFASDFLESTEDATLDQELKGRIISLSECLIAGEYIKRQDFDATSGCRPKKKAHRLSTGYHIINNFVTLPQLQSRLPVGPGDPGSEYHDVDGNLWYQRGWTVEQTKANAKDIYVSSGGTPDVPLAYEGYEAGDPRRDPNTKDPQKPIVSAHTRGQAIDLSRRNVVWIKDTWDAEHERVINSYGLHRPVDKSSPYGSDAAEYWHYEKLPTAPPERPAPGADPDPGRPQEPSPAGQKITNTENVRLVRDPEHWNEEAFILKRLPKGTVVEVVDRGAGKPFNETDSRYQWWFVKAGGAEGWVMQVLLDDAPTAP